MNLDPADYWKNAQFASVKPHYRLHCYYMYHCTGQKMVWYIKCFINGKTLTWPTRSRPAECFWFPPVDPA